MYFQGPLFIPILLPLSLMSISPIFIFFITIFIFIKLADYNYILTILTISTIICNANHMIIHLPHCYCSCSTSIVLLRYAISITSYALYLLLTIIYMKLLLLHVVALLAAASARPVRRSLYRRRAGVPWWARWWASPPTRRTLVSLRVRIPHACVRPPHCYHQYPSIAN